MSLLSLVGVCEVLPSIILLVAVELTFHLELGVLRLDVLLVSRLVRWVSLLFLLVDQKILKFT